MAKFNGLIVEVAKIHEQALNMAKVLEEGDCFQIHRLNPVGWNTTHNFQIQNGQVVHTGSHDNEELLDGLGVFMPVHVAE